MAAKEKADRRFWLTIRNPHIEKAIKDEATKRGLSPSDVVNDRLETCEAREAALKEEIARLHELIVRLKGGSLPAVEEEGKW